MRRLVKGALAGAAGTTLLNAVTYLDMAVSGRPASSVPEQAVDRMAQRLGISIGDVDEASSRRSALGALMGLMTGITAGAVYGVCRPLALWVPRPLASVAVGLGTMAMTDSSIAALGITDPAEWSARDWASDVVPHLAFGAGVVATFDAFGIARRDPGTSAIRIHSRTERRSRSWRARPRASSKRATGM
jgi:hypothetical protein